MQHKLSRVLYVNKLFAEQTNNKTSSLLKPSYWNTFKGKSNSMIPLLKKSLVFFFYSISLSRSENLNMKNKQKKKEPMWKIYINYNTKALKIRYNPILFFSKFFFSHSPANKWYLIPVLSNSLLTKGEVTLASSMTNQTRFGTCINVWANLVRSGSCSGLL